MAGLIIDIGRLGAAVPVLAPHPVALVVIGVEAVQGGRGRIDLRLG